MYDNSLTDDAPEKAFDITLDPNAIEDAHMSTKLEHLSGDANKLSYMTPKVGGLQLGLSFAPNNEDTEGGENNALNVGEAPQTDIIEMALRYSGKTGGISYRFGYSTVEGNTEANGEADPESTSVGFRLGLGNWTFGGNQSEYDNLGQVDSLTYADSVSIETTNYGQKYKLNKDSYIGLTFTDGEETHSNGTLTSYDEAMNGGGTMLNSGVSLGYYYSMAEGKHDEDDSEVSILGMTIALNF